MSNETPKLSPKKTKSAPKILLIAVLAVVCALIIAGIAIRHHHLATSTPSHMFDPPPSSYSLELDKKTYHLQTAWLESDQEKGLGDRLSLPANQGMLFWYPSVDTRCFWMKDMHFPLDIIWADGNKNVTHIEPNLSPATYPQTYCFTGKYVIELNAGEAAQGHLQTGQTLKF